MEEAGKQDGGGGPIICEWWVMSNTGKSAINIPDSMFREVC